MKNRVNDKINKTIEEVKDVNEEDIKEVDEVSEEPEKVTVELTPDKLDQLMALLSNDEKTEAVEVDEESKVKKFFGKLKPTKKKLAIAGGVLAAIAGGVAMGKLSGNKEEAPVDYPELPDNDNYNPPREDYVEETETEDSNIEVDEF